MRILVINSGSSSIKFSLFDSLDGSSGPASLYEGELTSIGELEAALELKSAEGKDLLDPSQASVATKATSPGQAIRAIIDIIGRPQLPQAEAIGYRVVHPGAKLVGHQRITPRVLEDLDQAAAFAPLHDPAVLEVIREGMARFPNLPHFACFDTEFHRTMPPEATTYPLPLEYREQGVRRYGFHGLSCESIVRQLTAAGPLPGRVVIAHLGSGCSVTAVHNGESIDTSMGLTPTGGIVMGTRPGDLDPGAVLYLLRKQTGDREQATAAVEKMLNHKAGMVALTGLDNDMKEVRKAAAANDPAAILALRVFTRSITKAIGAYAFLMGGLDAIVFAGGIGEHDPLTRQQAVDGLANLGISLDAELNFIKESRIRTISTAHSATIIFVVPAQEDLMIAVHVDQMARSVK